MGVIQLHVGQPVTGFPGPDQARTVHGLRRRFVFLTVMVGSDLLRPCESSTVSEHW